MTQHPRTYSTSENARRAVLAMRAASALAAGRPTGPTEAALDRLAAQACAREAAEDAANEKARLSETQRRADAKAARRAASVWW